MNLSNLSPAEGSTRNNKRLGRGTGSGRGGTSTRGHKGQKSRSGYSKKSGFEGGQMPLQRRVPKFGFKNINRVEYKGVNLDVLQGLNEQHGATTMDAAFFVASGLASKNAKIKVLGRGEITQALEVHAHAFSKSAVEAIEKAGGKAVTL
ncbi:50S ribosomal protein L15 [Hymenobacter persicinus]|uniref:Large ribosomal subunit protein uL15 n=1 Tax=Hymenobacter persicinus TaxID=2025506 RepID=A0A4Q5LHP4_9BACT|nr:50S ribosomal protein L15 [Hymenobacter persicinus]RYU84366.1 50S ribosomal protein L15 [Hymenobacter persicinus]